jgi:hypothetical protein
MPTALWTDSPLQQDGAALVASSPAPSPNVNLGPVKREYLRVSEGGLEPLANVLDGGGVDPWLRV